MKHILRFVYVSLIFVTLSCTRENEERHTAPDPSAQILSAIKVYAGSNPSIKITYKLSNLTNVTKTLIRNLNRGFSGAAAVEIPAVEGEAIVYDHSNFDPSAKYYFTFNMNTGLQVSTAIMTYNF